MSEVIGQPAHERKIHVNRRSVQGRQIATAPHLENRDMILPTNVDTRTFAGLPDREPLAYVEEELERMFAGKEVLIIDYAGRNRKIDTPHFPGSDVDFRAAWEKAEKSLARFKPKKFIVLSQAEDPYGTIRDLPEDKAAVYHTGGDSSGAAANTNGYVNWDGTPIDIAKGGNKRPLQRILRAKVDNGLPYVGTSAGQMNAMGLVVPHLDAHSHMHITRDPKSGELRVTMPVDGMNLVRNRGLATHPHYDGNRPTHYGDETQHDAIREILNRNPWVTIIGMVDNSALKIEGTKMTIIGDKETDTTAVASAFIMSLNPETGLVDTKRVIRGADLSYLLDQDLRERPETRIQRSRMPRSEDIFQG